MANILLGTYFIKSSQQSTVVYTTLSYPFSTEAIEFQRSKITLPEVIQQVVTKLSEKSMLFDYHNHIS